MSTVTENEQATPVLDQSRHELAALLAGCGVSRAERVLFSLSGRDRVRWLNGMVTNNIRDLAPGHGVYAFVLNPQGHILGDLYVFNRGESLIAEIERVQAETLVPILRKYIIMDKVEIEDLSDKLVAIALTGPKSADVLAAVGLGKDLGTLETAEESWQQTTVTTVRGDNPSVPSYELWIAAEKAESLWNALLQAGAERVGNETLETVRILCGIPKIGQDVRDRTLPHETGQERALNFTKGCYIGQEIVERIRSRGAVHRTLIGFEIEGPVPSTGTKVQNEGKDVGEITSVMSAPLKGKWLAIGFLRKEFAGGDKALTAGDASVKPATLPFKNMFA